MTSGPWLRLLSKKTMSTKTAPSQLRASSEHRKDHIIQYMLFLTLWIAPRCLIVNSSFTAWCIPHFPSPLVRCLNFPTFLSLLGIRIITYLLFRPTMPSPLRSLMLLDLHGGRAMERIAPRANIMLSLHSLSDSTQCI